MLVFALYLFSRELTSGESGCSLCSGPSSIGLSLGVLDNPLTELLGRPAISIHNYTICWCLTVAKSVSLLVRPSLGLRERREYLHSWSLGEWGGGGRMLPRIYDEPLTGSNSPAVNCVKACHGHGISKLCLAKNYPQGFPESILV